MSKPQGLCMFPGLQPQICDTWVFAVALCSCSHHGSCRGRICQGGNWESKRGRRKHQVRGMRSQVRVKVRVCMSDSFQLQLSLDLWKNHTRELSLVYTVELTTFLAGDMMSGKDICYECWLLNDDMHCWWKGFLKKKFHCNVFVPLGALESPSPTSQS